MNQLSLPVTLPLPLHVEQGPLYVHLVLYKSCFLIKNLLMWLIRMQPEHYLQIRFLLTCRRRMFENVLLCISCVV